MQTDCASKYENILSCKLICRRIRRGVLNSEGGQGGENLGVMGAGSLLEEGYGIPRAAGAG